MQPYRPTEVQPSQGGDLITRMAYDDVGAANYVQKLDWRRIMDAEVRREGDIFFAPNGDDPGAPINEPITLIHHVKKGNGKSGLIIGTQSSVFRYYAFEDGNVYVGPPDVLQVFEVGVYADLSGEWLTLGTRFSGGHRWEAVDVAGITILNNGVDLPFSYDLNELEAVPLYQLREQGIAAVETIGEYNGALFLADISHLVGDQTASTLNGRSSDAILITQAGTSTVTASSAFFAPSDVGLVITWNSGAQAVVLSYTSPTQVTVDRVQGVVAGPVTVAARYGRVTGADRIQTELIWSNFGDPRDFASSVDGSITAGSDVLTFRYPLQSITQGDTILIEGAGASGSALSATIVQILNGQGTQYRIDTPALTTVVNGAVEKESAISSISGSQDLQDDGSAILRLIELQGRLVVLKDTSIFVGVATGNAAQPFTFQKIYSGPRTIFWRWMLTKVNGSFLIFAGRNAFYSLDLSSSVPQEAQKLTLCYNIFYDVATSLTLSDQCYAADNAITKEVWFVFPNAGTDKAICYDYQFNTCATLGAAYSAAATVKRPIEGIPVGPEEDWFVMGKDDGTLRVYSLTDLTQPAWQRTGSNYDSILKGGFVSFGDSFNEKDLRSYVVNLAASSPAPLEITLYGARNAHEPATTLFTRVIASPTYKNLIPTWFRRIYFQDKIRVTNSSANAKMVRRIFEPAMIDSRSATRHP